MALCRRGPGPVVAGMATQRSQKQPATFVASAPLFRDTRVHVALLRMTAEHWAWGRGRKGHGQPWGRASSVAMSTEKKETFRKYLETSGVIDAMTKVTDGRASAERVAEDGLSYGDVGAVAPMECHHSPAFHRGSPPAGAGGSLRERGETPKGGGFPQDAAGGAHARGHGGHAGGEGRPQQATRGGAGEAQPLCMANSCSTAVLRVPCLCVHRSRCKATQVSPIVAHASRWRPMRACPSRAEEDRGAGSEGGGAGGRQVTGLLLCERCPCSSAVERGFRD